jgi:hypothetical protein
MLRTLVMILASGGFFVVSCSSSLFAGVQIIAKMDKREATRGDEMHRPFLIVAEPGEGEGAFRAVSLGELPDLLENNEKISFLMSVLTGSEGSSGTKEGKTTYLVLENTPSEQLIEVSFSDDDITVWSRYKATRTTVTLTGTKVHVCGISFCFWICAIALCDRPSTQVEDGCGRRESLAGTL